MEATEANSCKLADFESGMLDEFPHLPFFSFHHHDFYRAAANFFYGSWLDEDPFYLATLTDRLQVVRLEFPVGFYQVFFFNFGTRVDYLVSEVTIVGDDEKPFGILIEAADGEKSFVGIFDEIERDIGMVFGTDGGADVALWFVNHVVPLLFHFGDRNPIHFDFILGEVDHCLGNQLDFSVDGYLTIKN